MSEPMTKSQYASTLNALDEMQQSMIYAARRNVLSDAERIIVQLEAERDALKAHINDAQAAVGGSPYSPAHRW